VLLCVAVAAAPAAASNRRVPSNPIGVHSMLYLNTPPNAIQVMFREAAAIGASTIRLDIELSGVFVNANSPPDWSGVDDYMRLSRQYHLRVLANLDATPYYMDDCPPGVPSDLTFRCPPADPRQWGREAGEIAAHTRGVIDEFEIINEPDGGWAFFGTPQQYASILAAAYDAIHAANPRARVALGGLMNIGAGGRAWLSAVFATPGANAAHKFDIANIHVRTPDPASAAPVVRHWLRYFRHKRFHGQLWVTETGYPADPAFQTDPAYHDGPTSQARWMTTAIPAMIHAGAAIVFVTERDSLTGRYASEGVLQSADPLTSHPQFTFRPSFYAVRQLSRRKWPVPMPARCAKARRAHHCRDSREVRASA
jgi:hypothetical protein